MVENRIVADRREVVEVEGVGEGMKVARGDRGSGEDQNPPPMNLARKEGRRACGDMRLRRSVQGAGRLAPGSIGNTAGHESEPTRGR
jgi:hypothetical protein